MASECVISVRAYYEEVGAPTPYLSSGSGPTPLPPYPHLYRGRGWWVVLARGWIHALRFFLIHGWVAPTIKIGAPSSPQYRSVGQL